MRKYLAVLLCAFLCAQTVYAMPVRDTVIYEETAEETEEGTEEEKEEGEESNTSRKADGPVISAETGIIMEASGGKVLYEKEADRQLPPASVTKIMTMLLIFDALDRGQIKLEDTVTVSEYAASMGGSQVFLEPGESQTVDTMLKCIAVASANDACVSFKKGRQ